MQQSLAVRSYDSAVIGDRFKIDPPKNFRPRTFT